MTTFMALICKVLFPSISTFEKPPTFSCPTWHGARVCAEGHALALRLSPERSERRIQALGRLHIGGAAYCVWARPPTVGGKAHRHVEVHSHTTALAMKTPQALGLTMPPHLLLLADEVLKEESVGGLLGIIVVERAVRKTDVFWRWLTCTERKRRRKLKQGQRGTRAIRSKGGKEVLKTHFAR
jgi:hypothetical protein